MFRQNSIAFLALAASFAKAYSGTGTVYLQGGVAGSCGVVHSDSDLIAALPEVFMNNQYKSPYCGRQLQVTNVGSNDGVGGKGKTLTVTVADTCPSCAGDSVDFSVGTWDALTDNAPYGTMEIEWDFI